MGESISARTNQLAYYVPLEYVSGDGKSLDQKKYAAYTGISESTLKGIFKQQPAGGSLLFSGWGLLLPEF